MAQELSTSSTPVCDHLRASGAWNPLWDQLYAWDPEWTEQFMHMQATAYRRGGLPRKTVELICLAAAAACKHMYAPGVRRHIRAALELGATREEILEVLELTHAFGIHSCSLGVPILAEERANAGNRTGDGSDRRTAVPTHEP